MTTIRTGSALPAPPRNDLPRRPRAVTFVAWLHVVEGIVFAALGLILLAPNNDGIDARIMAADTFGMLENLGFGLIGVLLGCLAWVVALGLFQLRSWAWLMAMTAQGITLAIGLYARYTGTPEYASLLLAVIVVLTLNQREVRRAFRRFKVRDD